MSAAFDGLTEYEYLYDQYKLLVGQKPPVERKSLDVDKLQQALEVFRRTVAKTEDKKRGAALLERQCQHLIQNLSKFPAFPTGAAAPAMLKTVGGFLSLAERLEPCGDGWSVLPQATSYPAQ